MTLNLGAMRQQITLQNRTQTPDGDGGITETWTPLSPSIVWASITVMNGKEVRLAGSIQAAAPRQVALRFHPQVTTNTRVSWTDYGGTAHVANVTDVQDVDGLGVELRLTCMEIANA